MNDSEKEAYGILRNVLWLNEDTHEELYEEFILAVALALQKKDVEIDRLTKLKDDFKSEIERLTKENNERFDLVLELQKRVTDLREELKCWETDSGLTKKLRETEYEKNIDFWQRRCTKKNKIL